jgi:membrane protein CcdC involved in cytochrome C biogenesis
LEAWFLGKENLRFETICDIKEKFEIYTKHVFLKQTFKNPTVLRYLFILAVVIIALIIRPELIKDLLPFLR